MRHLIMTCVLALAAATVAPAQQVGDPSFEPPIARPAYAAGKGPVVLLDEAHHNFHTASGRYQAFVRVLERDGYVVRPSRARFSKEALAGAAVLVIANALAERNREDWTLPTPSAFADDEVEAVREWVRGGGSLLLVADHMPFPGAAERLAAAFDVRFSNGFAMVPGTDGGAIAFTRENGALADHAVTRGRNAGERVSRVVSFTGSAFRPGKGAVPVMSLPKGVVTLEPKEAWQFSEATPKVDVGGWCQGAVLRFGKGRVAVFGEAAMFTAQLAGSEKRPFGMNSPEAAENPRFLLNVAHWLTGLLGE
jgi:hypothetical protein